MNTNLTEKQILCRALVITHQEYNEGETPTLDQLSKAMDCSRQRVSQYINRLIELGYMKKKNVRQRLTIKVLR